MGNRIKTFPGNIAGSVFTAASSDAIKPPVGHIFVAFRLQTQTQLFLLEQLFMVLIPK